LPPSAFMIYSTSGGII